MNKWIFQTGVPEDTKLMDCPGCYEKACHWIGGGLKDIECLNKSCEYFKLPPGYKKKLDDLEETADLTDDFTFCAWFVQFNKPNKNDDVFIDITFKNAPKGIKIEFYTWD